MASAFWDRKGVLMVETMQEGTEGTKITPQAYCKTLTKTARIHSNKRCEMLTSSIVLLHPHAHTAAHTPALLVHFNCKLFDHPPPLQPQSRPEQLLHVYLPKEIIEKPVLM
jgi:hypothetical protein